MAVLDQIGTDLQTGVSTLAGYVVVSVTSGGKDVRFEDIIDENGALKTRLIFHRHDKIVAELIGLLGATPTVDFPEGQIASVGTFLTDAYIDSAKVTETGGAMKVSLEATAIGIT